MPVDLVHLREQLLPGLQQSFALTKEIYAANVWNSVFAEEAPLAWVPELSLPAALAVGAAAVIIKNPEVTRRFWNTP